MQCHWKSQHCKLGSCKCLGSPNYTLIETPAIRLSWQLTIGVNNHTLPFPRKIIFIAGILYDKHYLKCLFYAAILHGKCLLMAQRLSLKFRKLYKDSNDTAGLTFYDSIHFPSGYRSTLFSDLHSLSNLAISHSSCCSICSALPRYFMLSLHQTFLLF